MAAEVEIPGFRQARAVVPEPFPGPRAGAFTSRPPSPFPRYSLMKLFRLGCAVLLLAAPLSLFASSLLEVQPASDRVLVLHFADGKVRLHEAGQALTDDVADVSPLATAALAAGAFRVASADDPAYQSAKAPEGLGRKSKGTGFADVRETWVNGFGWRNSAPSTALEHWVYLRLPTALVSGCHYTVRWNLLELNTTTDRADYIQVERLDRSETVHVNALGYQADSVVKFGYLYHWMGDLGPLDLAGFEGADFQIVSEVDGSIAFTGKVAFRKAATNQESAAAETPAQNFLGAPVYQCDFSPLNREGLYRLVVPRLGCSWPFRISADAYRQAFHEAMRGLFQQRSGIELVRPFADAHRPAPHHVKLTPGFAGLLKYSTARTYDFVADGGGAPDKTIVEAGAKGALEGTWGWYQDAGDWDGYVSHLNIPSGLLSLYLLYPAKFTDGELTIPESGNGIPDIVDEGAWLLRFCHRLRIELLEKGWGTGGVGTRVFGDYWGTDLLEVNGRTLAQGSWQDTTRDWYVSGEDPFSTYRYAGGAAQLAEILAGLGKTDPEGIDWLAEARAAYDWARRNSHPADEARSVAGATLGAHRAYAALGLYRVTGESSYCDQLVRDLSGLSLAGSVLAHDDIRAAVCALALDLPAGRSIGGDAAARAKAALQASFENVQTTAARRATRWGGDFSFPMLVGQGSTPMVTQASFAAKALPESRSAIVSVVQTTCDYFLGTNPLNMVWLSGCGPRSPRGIFNLDDRCTGVGTRRGVVPYGPWRFPDGWIGERMAFSIWWAWDTTYPSIDPRGSGQPATGAAGPGTWPGHEAWFDNALAPQTGEYTLWQNGLHAALNYGFLSADHPRPPERGFDIQPTAVAANRGTGAWFYASAKPGRTVAYQWLKDGTPIPAATSQVLRFESVAEKDAANYSVQITDWTGSTTSVEAALKVLGTPVDPNAGGIPPPTAESASASQTRFSLHSLFQDGQVLQRDVAFEFFGSAPAGAVVSLRLDGREQKATAGTDGRWSIPMAACRAGGPHRFVFLCNGQERALNDVLFGDVWLAGGQSNMEYKLAEGVVPALEAAAFEENPKIRFFEVPKTFGLVPARETGSAEWRACTRANFGRFSAIAYFFARKVQREVGVPVGIVGCYFGGSSIEAWMPPEDLTRLPHLAGPDLSEFKGPSSRFPEFGVENERRAARTAELAEKSYEALKLGVVKADFDDRSWPLRAIPTVGLPPRQIQWLRYVFTLPDDHPADPHELSLGSGGMMTAYVNGTEVVRTGGGPCRVELPAGLLHTGDNLLVLRLANPWWPPVLESSGDDFYVANQRTRKRCSLAGSWRCNDSLETPLPAFVSMQTVPTALFHGMLSPLFGYRFSGVIWYQGENNGDSGGQYQALFPAMIRAWRARFGNPGLFFCFVQLANWGTPNTLPEDKGWPWLREAQQLALGEPGTGLATAIDVGEQYDIHPKNKVAVGERLANVALKHHYGRSVAADAPQIVACRFEGGRAELSLKGDAPLRASTSPVGFSLAGADRRFHRADAVWRTGNLELSSNEVKEPVAVRYGWARNPILSVFDVNGLPLLPFRTDDWPEAPAGQ